MTVIAVSGLVVAVHAWEFLIQRIMSNKSRLSLNRFKVNLVGWAGASFLALLRKSLRLKVDIRLESFSGWSNEPATILVFWHAQQLMMPWIYLDHRGNTKEKPVHVLISRSQDGRYIAKAMSILGIPSIAGSSSRGGKQALIQLVRLANRGSHIAITPDGPKGPVNKAKTGALKVSQLSGAKILPAGFAASNFWTFNSWDRMILPKPFAKAVIITGNPIVVPRDSDENEINELAVRLEGELNRLSEEARELL